MREIHLQIYFFGLLIIYLGNIYARVWVSTLNFQLFTKLYEAGHLKYTSVDS